MAAKFGMHFLCERENVETLTPNILLAAKGVRGSPYFPVLRGILRCFLERDMAAVAASLSTWGSGVGLTIR